MKGLISPRARGVCVCVHPDSKLRVFGKTCALRSCRSRGMPGNSAVGIQRRHCSFPVIWNPDADSTYLLSVNGIRLSREPVSDLKLSLANEFCQAVNSGLPL